MLDRARRRTASCSGTPSAASSSARPTARSRRRCRPRWRPGCKPILCVGETEEERERGRHRAQAAPPGPGGPREGRRTSGSARSSIAYEPIWAIGTGLVATPEQAQEAIAFVRALVAGPRPGGRPSAVRDPLRRLASSPTTPPSCWRCRTSTARSSAARRWTPASFAAIVEAARGARRDASTVPAVCLVVLDGWGLAPRRARATRSSLADTPVFDRLWATLPAHAADARAARGRAAARGRWATREVGHLNLGAGAVVKQDLTRIDEARGGRRAGRERRAARGDARAPSACT